MDVTEKIGAIERDIKSFIDRNDSRSKETVKWPTDTGFTTLPKKQSA